MAVKLTKNELKNQRDQLKQFERYLPTLQLKKQQLQTVIRQINLELSQKEMEKNELISNLDNWIDVFAENGIFSEELKLDNLIKPKNVEYGKQNIAGVDIPVFYDLKFYDVDYDINVYPLWVDKAIIKLKEIAKIDAVVNTLNKQVELLGMELKTTTQRVNLFEKVKIPEAKENIRLIGIYLGDQQTSSVVRGKIAQKKLHNNSEALND